MLSCPERARTVAELKEPEYHQRTMQYLEKLATHQSLFVEGRAEAHQGTNDDSYYYTGVTHDQEERMLQHKTGGADEFSYTFSRRPLELVHCEKYDSPYEAIKREKHVQGWSRKKKEALIRGNINELKRLARNKKKKEQLKENE